MEASFIFMPWYCTRSGATRHHNHRSQDLVKGLGGRATNKQSAKGATFALLATMLATMLVTMLATILVLLYIEVVCAQIIGADHFLFNVSRLLDKFQHFTLKLQTL